MLTLIHSNSMPALEAELAARFEAPGHDDLAPDILIVPTAGVARWLTYRIAERRGICANVEFPYPAQFIWRLFAAVLPDVPQASPFDPAAMAWRLYALLGRLPDAPAYAPLRAWLRRADARSRMELAQRIAGLFDQYLVYRPDWLQAWAEGKRSVPGCPDEEAWQALLWRELLRGTGSRFASHPKEAFFAELAARDAQDVAALLPRRVSLFGVPLLPPLYLEIFARLARHIDVDLYALNPCREFWADIVAERDLARLALRGEARAAYRDVGHALLASWGRQARDNLALLSALGGEDNTQDVERFAAPTGETLLATLQRSILDLADLGAAGLALAAADGSLQIHACHSLTRQLEVLHDRLLALFEALPDLRPADVVVMTPDIDAAAPLIDAVFGAVPRERFLPYTVTGRARPDAAPLLRAFDALLALPGSRFDAAAVYDLLQTPPVARRFALDEDGLEQIRDWLRESGVRWGRDAAHRAALGLPGEGRHSWADGLSRLLLGYALPGAGQQLCADVLPYDEVEGSQALSLGRLARFVDELARLARELERPRAMSDWMRQLNALVERFFLPEESELQEVQRLREALAGLGAAAAAAGVTEAVPPPVLRALLQETLAAAAPGAVPGGAVTFCGIGALRGLPYRVVCLVGLDDGQFPRSPAPLEFDLMAQQPRLGDRARRDDERGQFLDALLAARDVLYLAYTGRSQRDNAPLPPSVVVAELLDYLGRCVAGGRAEVQRRLVVEHPLQAFSRRYFDGELFSYAGEYVAAARAVAPGPLARRGPRPLCDAPLPPPEAEWRRVSLEQLIRFFRHPVRFFLRERLRVELREAEEELPTTEPFALERADAWRLDDRLLQLALTGAAESQIERLALAGSELPHGLVGRLALGAQWREVSGFAALLAQAQPPMPAAPLAFDFALGEFVVSGSLRGLHRDGLFGYRLGKRGAADVVGAWLHHLVLNHLALNDLLPPDVGRVTRWLNRDVLTELPPLHDAAGHLAGLLDLYWRGLRQPLAFHPRSAMTRVFEDSLPGAQRTWAGSPQRPGESADPWYRLAYGEVSGALPEEFEALARAVLEPAYLLRRDHAAAAVEEAR